MEKGQKLMAAAFVLLFLGGCALTPERIAINYHRQTGVASIEGAGSVQLKVQVNDRRTVKDKVSCKKNGFGMEMAPISAVEAVDRTIHQAMEHELEARGFAVAKDASVTVEADLTRFYSDFTSGFFSGDAVAEMELGVLVSGKKRTVTFSRQYLARGVEPDIQLCSADNARLALEKALTEGMRQVFSDQEFYRALFQAYRE